VSGLSFGAGFFMASYHAQQMTALAILMVLSTQFLHILFVNQQSQLILPDKYPLSVMKKLFLFVLLLPVFAKAQIVTCRLGEVFEQRVVKNQLSDPWELIYGPDNFLWITESKNYKVSRINITTGAQTVLIDLSSQRNFPRYDKIPDTDDGGKPWPQGGLMGMALHPQLLSSNPYVYLAYVHSFSGVAASGDGCSSNFGGCFFTTRVVRYDYNSTAQTLSNPQILVDTIPGSNDHNSGRMTIAPVNGVDYLFYTVGDMGGGQFSNGNRPIKSQATDSYEGKVLRFNLVPDADADQYDRWIPNDNPFNVTGKQSAVWSTGHRNAQGIVYGVAGTGGRIYSCEHGPFSDDEVNVVEQGKNYGHPLVVGKNDGNYNNAAVGASCNTSLPGTHNSSSPIITSESANATTIGTNFREPIFSVYPSSNTKISSIFNGTITNCFVDNNTWDSEGPSSLAFYDKSAITGWKRTLLMPTLKGGKLIRFVLNPIGDGITGDTVGYFYAANRYRDIAFNPFGDKLYLIVDSSGTTSGPSSQNPVVSTNRGSILEFRYLSGGTLAINETPRPQRPILNYVLGMTPNPTPGLLKVQLKSSTALPVRFQITDIAGAMVQAGSSSQQNFDINISRQAAGAYFVHLQDQWGNLLGIEKIVKQ
jgi:PQQ-dependent dehydrogenase (s-GDH family)